MKLLGKMIGHNGWVTAITATADPNLVVSSSRDKTIIQWELSYKENLNKEISIEGRPSKRLYGHEHFVEDVVVSSDGRFALSGSWDKTIRLWDLEAGETTARFVGHSGDVMSVSFSADNRQICSGSRDKTLKLWNTLGQHNYTVSDTVNKDWISCVAFSPKRNDDNASSLEVAQDPAASDNNKPSVSYDFLVYGSWNGTIKKFDYVSKKVLYNMIGHDGAVTSISISPDASLCASGGKDGRLMLWELITGKKLREFDLEGPVVSLKFNPCFYQFCAAWEGGFKILALIVNKDEEQEQFSYSFNEGQKMNIKCTSAEWSLDGEVLFCGFQDGSIQMFGNNTKPSKTKGEAEESDLPEEEHEADLE